MRKCLFLPLLLLVACGGDDGGVPERHVPQIIDLAITPDMATFLEGDGRVVITAEVSFQDSGRDIQTLWVRMPDGTTVEFDESRATETGTINAEIVMSTEVVGVFPLDFGLLDKTGYGSMNRSIDFTVALDTQGTDWTNRLSGLPDNLSDVVWNGDVFIAVGDRGAVLTSADGITWVARDSGTDANLHAVAADGRYVVAVGFEIEAGERGIILQSTDQGASWTVKSRPAEAVLQAVAIGPSQVVVSGSRFSWGTAITMISGDRGETWRPVDSWSDENLSVNDLVYQDGMFVAVTNSFLRAGPGAWVVISSDGELWNEYSVSDENAVLHSVFHDGSRFIVAASGGAVYTSPDGFNWAQLQTPVRDVFYTGVASSGPRLVVAGASDCGYLGGLCYSKSVGLSSTDGGVTWTIFNIDGDYESSGLAWGKGRFVSVGGKGVFSSEGRRGAIYTLE